MDPGGIGAIIGITIMSALAISVCIYDRCKDKAIETTTTNPLLIKKQSFRVKNLFSHVDI